MKLPNIAICSDKSLLKVRDRSSENQTENQDTKTNEIFSDQLNVFYEGLWKFASIASLKPCGTIRIRYLLSYASVVCSLNFDPGEEHIAAVGISL